MAKTIANVVSFMADLDHPLRVWNRCSKAKSWTNFSTNVNGAAVGERGRRRSGANYPIAN